MANYGIFPISKFAKYSRINPVTLHFYDKIGLLSPITRGENRYRYYSSDQLAVANVIRNLQESGLSLAEIKEMREQCNPENVHTILTRQMRWIDEKIEELTQTRKLFAALQRSIQSVLNVDEQAITVQSLPEEPIILGAPYDYRDGKNEYDALLEFYQSVEERYLDVDFNYPAWGYFPEEYIKRRDWSMPKQFYFYNPGGRDKRPAALYAIGYARGGYGQHDTLYQRLLEYIDENGLEICGGAYEEYPLNEVSITDDENYLMRVMITVRKTAGAG